MFCAHGDVRRSQRLVHESYGRDASSSPPVFVHLLMKLQYYGSGATLAFSFRGLGPEALFLLSQRSGWAHVAWLANIRARSPLGGRWRSLGKFCLAKTHSRFAVLLHWFSWLLLFLHKSNYMAWILRLAPNRSTTRKSNHSPCTLGG